MQPHDTSTFAVVPREKLTFHPNGMSGGSAFAVVSSPTGFEVAFAGIIVRGGTEGFRVIKRGSVLSFLDTNNDWGERQTG
jgi:hypothetical protein